MKYRVFLWVPTSAVCCVPIGTTHTCLSCQARILAAPVIVSLFLLFPVLPSMLDVADSLSFYFFHSVV